MGVKQSKDGEIRAKRAIDSTFKLTVIPKFDGFYQEVGTLLDSVEKIRKSVQDQKEAAVESSHTWRLRDYSFIEVFRVLFWSLSANKGGIGNAGVSIVRLPPYIKIDSFVGLSDETIALANAVKNYLDVFVDGPSILIDLINKIGALTMLAPEMVNIAKSEGTIQHLKKDQISTVREQMKYNSKKLEIEYGKAKKLLTVVLREGNELRALAVQFKEIYVAADEIGMVASGQKLRTPEMILRMLHPGVKKSLTEIFGNEATGENVKEFQNLNEKRYRLWSNLSTNLTI